MKAYSAVFSVTMLSDGSEMAIKEFSGRRKKRMLAINIDDVMNVLNTCKPYLIALAVVLLAAIIVTVAVRKLAAPKK